MYCRIFHRTLIPIFRTYSIACNFSKHFNSSLIIPVSNNRSFRRTSGSHTQSRFFSLQITPEENLTSFEEVEKATSDSNILIVDVREPDEIKEHGKIPNSINIPLGDITKALSTMSEKEFEKSYNRIKPAKDCPIIFYCMIGKRSAKAQQNAMNLGYKNVKNYLGSWTEWASKVRS